MSNMPPPVAIRTYQSIRLGVVAVILALGFAVAMEIRDSPDACVQRSLSAYYYTPVRPVFVGALLIIGFAMIAIWGRTPWEDIALNLSGLLLMVVALVPTLDANYCSLPKAMRGQVPSTETKSIADDALITANAEAVSRSFTALLFVLAVILAFLATAGVKAYFRGSPSERPTKRAMVSYAVTWGLTAIAGLIYWVLFQDADHSDSAFNHKVHSWSANIAVALIILAVVFAAVQKAQSDDTAKTKWVWFYGLVAAAMVSAAVVIKGGDKVDLFSRWTWGDDHPTFLVEAILIALIGIFWILQTIDRRDTGAPTY